MLVRSRCRETWKGDVAEAVRSITGGWGGDGGGGLKPETKNMAPLFQQLLPPCSRKVINFFLITRNLEVQSNSSVYIFD